MAHGANSTLIIGAGIGGHAAALRLASAGIPVEVVELADRPGGKLRSVPSIAGPVDAGPTVMTMLPVFESLFRDAGASIFDHLTLHEEPVLARHFWPDGQTLDLFANPEASAAAVREFGGTKSEAEFRTFSAEAKRLFEGFLEPVMQAPRPNIGGILKAVSRNPSALRTLRPSQTLWRALARRFSNPRLAQLFARYATYVGGSPFESPALLMLIAHAEAQGVWCVEGGMTKLATAIEHLATQHGAQFRYGVGATEIMKDRNGAFRVILSTGEEKQATNVIFNGDPAALHKGDLGITMKDAVKPSGVKDRSLSAWVWSFAASPRGRNLAHHNVFFNDRYQAEFDDIQSGNMPDDATLYVCAQDRRTDLKPDGPERFEIIMNGAPVTSGASTTDGEYRQCRDRTFTQLSEMGLDFSPLPDRPTLSTPADFAARFPGSGGSLYGRSPHGMMASFQRPITITKTPGLYLVAGGVHPGAGLPMAASSGKHAAEAIVKDRASTSTFLRTATRGGMSTASRTMANTASRSSGS